MSRKWFLRIGAVVLLAAVSAPASAQQSSAAAGREDDETAGLWFVELSNPPKADGGNPDALRTEKQTFRNAARQAQVVYRERYAYDELWNGFSISARPSELGKLSRLPGVTAIYPVDTATLPETDPIEADLATALAMSGADVAQNTLGLTGAGVRVAVMDTGIDYDHPDLGGCFGTGCRVVTGWDFVGDAFNADPAEQAGSGRERSRTGGPNLNCLQRRNRRRGL